MTADYEESQCIFFGEDAAIDGGTEVLVRAENVWHYDEVCLTSKKISSDCVNRLYVFERIPGYRFEAGSADKEAHASNRSECEDMCLNHTDFPCRSVSFDRMSNKCLLSKETRHMNPHGFKSDPAFDYMENMCLKRMYTCISTFNSCDCNVPSIFNHRNEHVYLCSFHPRA